ncbi:hypothetical protein CIK05_15980 [Bdellovibrio sp. qaytius]|nr:hypothetical protein CIK05_15980 [Bdellovibrio sp. qaytius]
MLGCNKRDPHPENKDKVYAQLNVDLGTAKVAQAYVNEYINGNKKDLETAVPQSGEEPVYTKRINEGLNKLTYANQQVRMYEVRIEERLLYVQRRYLESLTPNGRKWPDDEDTAAELIKLQMLREKVARVNDSLNKKDGKDVPRGTKEEAGKHGEEKAAGSEHAAPAEHH